MRPSALMSRRAETSAAAGLCMTLRLLSMKTGTPKLPRTLAKMSVLPGASAVRTAISPRLKPSSLSSLRISAATVSAWVKGVEQLIRTGAVSFSLCVSGAGSLSSRTLSPADWAAALSIERVLLGAAKSSSSPGQPSPRGSIMVRP